LGDVAKGIERGGAKPILDSLVGVRLLDDWVRSSAMGQLIAEQPKRCENRSKIDYSGTLLAMARAQFLRSYISFNAQP
jgi:hypothetical protein